ncbi:MAG TPA: type II toxin-antitoxin system VapC family toxin [Bryobacteraceae bacterium]
MSGAYFDTAYIVKCYVNEPGSREIRDLARSSESVASSSLCIAELSCVIHRKIREGTLSRQDALTVREDFLEDIRADTWLLIPVSDRILHRVELLTRSLPEAMPLRTLDAIHIASLEENLLEMWTNDRHLLAAAAHLGLKGRQVQAGSRS